MNFSFLINKQLQNICASLITPESSSHFWNRWTILLSVSQVCLSVSLSWLSNMPPGLTAQINRQILQSSLLPHRLTIWKTNYFLKNNFPTPYHIWWRKTFHFNLQLSFQTWQPKSFSYWLFRILYNGMCMVLVKHPSHYTIKW